MHPILFEFSGITVYSYGLFIALGAIAGVAYMAVRGKKEAGLNFDQANNLFLLIFLAAFIGGKVFLFFEEPEIYIHDFRRLLTGRGFVFYGSFIFAVPTMIWFFRRNKLHPYKMLDVMAITTCLVHMFGRIGCFMAGCCYGSETESIFAVIFSDPACIAEPKNTPLHPTQLYEAMYIFLVMMVLFYIRDKRNFYGQLFLIYLILYAVGRFVLEYFRGDLDRGFVIQEYVSNSQFISLAILVTASVLYRLWSKRNKIIYPVISGKV